MKFLLLIFISLLWVNCSHYGKRGHYRQHKAEMWKTMDANSDGSVTKAEFDAAHSKKFTEMDADKDGKVTMDEKKAFKKAKWAKYGKSCSMKAGKSCSHKSCGSCNHKGKCDHPGKCDGTGPKTCSGKK